MGGCRHLTGDDHLGLGYVEHFHVEICGGKRDLPVFGGNQNIGKYGNRIAPFHYTLYVTQGSQEG